MPDVFFNLSPCSTQLKHPPEDTPPILERLSTDVEQLVYNTRHFACQFKGLVGTVISIKSKSQQGPAAFLYFEKGMKDNRMTLAEMACRMIKLYRICMVLLVFCLGLMVNGSQASPIRIAVPPIDNLLEEDGSGIYQRFVSASVESLGVEIQSLFYPYRRAIRAFDAHEVDCIYSLDEVLHQTYPPDELVSSFPLGKFSFHAFTAADKPAIVSVDELASLRLVAIMGHELYIKSVLQGSTITDMVMTEHQAVNMLNQGRVDVVIAALPDIQPYVSQLTYSPGFSLFTGYDRLNCHNTEGNRNFIRDLSQQLIKLKSERGYERLAGDLFVPF